MCYETGYIRLEDCLFWERKGGEKNLSINSSPLSCLIILIDELSMSKKYWNLHWLQVTMCCIFIRKFKLEEMLSKEFYLVGGGMYMRDFFFNSGKNYFIYFSNFHLFYFLNTIFAFLNHRTVLRKHILPLSISWPLL